MASRVIIRGGRTILFFLLPCICAAQSLRGCKTIFVQPMSESMDRFISAEIVKWGAIKVVTVQEKADCLASFGRPTSKVKIDSSGSAVVPTETKVETENASEKLPSSFDGFGYSKSAALDIVHRESSVVVWADAKTDTWAPMAGGPKWLARKLVVQLKKDYSKRK